MDNKIYDDEYNDAKEDAKSERTKSIYNSGCAFFIVLVSVVFTGYVMLMSFSFAIVPLHYLWRFIKWILGSFY